MLQLYKNIKQRRIELGLTQEELAHKLGYADKSMIAKIEKGNVDLQQTKILAFADALEIEPGDLMGWDLVEIHDFEKGKENFTKRICAYKDTYEKYTRHNVTKINVLGRVAAGIPIDAIEEIIDTEEISEDMAKTGNFFGLQIHGDSMEPRMYEGDVVIVRQQDDAESGDIVIALINGNDATCKRLMKYSGGISLIALNSKYEPLMFSNEDIINKPVKIIGKVVELRGKF